MSRKTKLLVAGIALVLTGGLDPIVCGAYGYQYVKFIAEEL